MRARDGDADGWVSVEHALRRGVVGLVRASATVPATLSEAVRAVRLADGDRAAQRLRRFAAVPEGAFVWTRDRDGLYRLGRIAGPWHFDASPAAAAAALHHGRATDWLDRPFGDDVVPAAVAATFARGGRNFQRTHDPGAEIATAALWAEAQRV